MFRSIIRRLGKLLTAFQSFLHRPKIKQTIKIILRTALVILVIIVAILGYIFLKPSPRLSQNLAEIKTLTYEESTNKVQQIIDSEEALINPVCKTKLMTHGQKAARVVVMFHGYTNCPAQMDELAQKVFDLGYNVYIPRLPYHGYKDKLTNDLEKLTPSDLTTFAAESVEIAGGLGDSKTLFGISAGAVIAGWAGYNYHINRTVLAAPLFSPAIIKFWQSNAAYTILDTIPSTFKWWDDDARENIKGPEYAYPRYSFKAIKSFMALSLDLQNELNSGYNSDKQSAKSIGLITLEHDEAIDNNVAREIMHKWSALPNVLLSEYQFPARSGLVHDFIDPHQVKANTEVCYKVLLQFLR